MLHADEISGIEKRMREEHARDLEALEALKRLRKYLPERDNLPKSGATTPTTPRTNEQGVRSGLKDVIRGIVSTQDPTRRWTRSSVAKALDDIGFEVRAKDKGAAINQSLRTLVSRGELSLISQGSGSALSVYGPSERKTDTVGPPSSPVQSTGRKEELAQFLLTHGPMSRVDIVAKAGLPEGTVSYCLNDTHFFAQVEGGNWNLTELFRRGIARTTQP